jgi:hypothetical protein
MASSNLEIKITAQNLASASIEQVNTTVQKFGDQLISVGKIASGVALGNVLSAAFGDLSKHFEAGITAAESLGAATRKLQREIGGTAEEVSGLISVFGRYGVDVDGASKALGIFAKHLGGIEDETTKAIEEGKGFAGVMQDLGIKTETSSGQIRPMNDLLLEVADKFENMPASAEKSKLAMDLFGKSGKDLIPILNLGRDGILAAEDAAKRYGLTLTNDNVEALKQLGVAHKDADQAVKGLEVQLGLAFLPVLKGVAQAAAGLAQGFNEQVAPALHTFADDVGIGAEALKIIWEKHLAPLAQNLSGVIQPAVIGLAAALGTTFVAAAYQAVAALAAQAAAFVAANLPIIALGAAVGVVAALVIGHWDEISAAAQQLGAWLGEVFTNLADNFSTFWTNTTTLFSSAWQGITDITGRAAQWLGDTWSRFATWLGDAFGGIGQQIQQSWNAAWSGLGGITGQALGWIGDRIGDFVNWLKSIPMIGDWVTGIGNAFSFVGAKAADFAGAIQSTASAAYHAVTSFDYSGFVAGAKSAIGGAIDWAWKAIQGIPDLIDEAKKRWAELGKQGAEDAGQKTGEAFAHGAAQGANKDKKGPLSAALQDWVSQVLADSLANTAGITIGDDFGQSMADGIRATQQTMDAALEEIIGGLAANGADAEAKIFERLKTTVDDEMTGTVQKIVEVGDAADKKLAELVSKASDDIVAAGKTASDALQSLVEQARDAADLKARRAALDENISDEERAHKAKVDAANLAYDREKQAAELANKFKNDLLDLEYKHHEELQQAKTDKERAAINERYAQNKADLEHRHQDETAALADRQKQEDADRARRQALDEAERIFKQGIDKQRSDFEEKLRQEDLQKKVAAIGAEYDLRVKTIAKTLAEETEKTQAQRLDEQVKLAAHLQERFSKIRAEFGMEDQLGKALGENLKSYFDGVIGKLHDVQREMDVVAADEGSDQQAASTGSGYSALAAAAYIRQAAANRGIDPNIAVQVAASEGLNNPVGDGGRSFGPFQLYTGGGLGNAFQQQTGLNPADYQNNWPQQVDWILNWVLQNGWNPGGTGGMHGATAAGIGNWQGIPTYDQGGWLPTGKSTVLNLTGRPEAVLTPQQLAGMSRGGVRDVHVHLSGNTMLADDFVTAQRLAQILKPELDRIVSGPA